MTTEELFAGLNDVATLLEINETEAAMEKVKALRWKMVFNASCIHVAFCDQDCSGGD